MALPTPEILAAWDKVQSCDTAPAVLTVIPSSFAEIIKVSAHRTDCIVSVPGTAPGLDQRTLLARTFSRRLRPNASFQLVQPSCRMRCQHVHLPVEFVQSSCLPCGQAPPGLPFDFTPELFNLS